MCCSSPVSVQGIQIQNYLTSAESKAFRDAAEAIGFVHQGSLGPTMGEAYRDNDRIAVNDPALAEAIWSAGLNKFFSDFKIRGKVAVGLNPNIRFYRYVAFAPSADLDSTYVVTETLSSTMLKSFGSM